MTDKYLSVFLLSNLLHSIFTPLLSLWAQMYVGKTTSFCFLRIRQQRLSFLVQRLHLMQKPSFDFLSVRLLISAGLHVFRSSFIQLHKRPLLYLPHHPFSLPHTYPPSRLLSFSLLALGWSAAWGFKGGSREGGLEQTGRREETWKEGAGESKRKGESRGGVNKTEKTPGSEAMIWLLLPSPGERREERKDTERAKKNRREWKRESLLTWPQGALSSLSFFLPLFIIFYTNCPHTKH